MNKLMVLESAWHYRKATYWDMQKCATCDKALPDSKHGQSRLLCDDTHIHVSEGYGCVNHSEIEQPEKLTPHVEGK